MKAFVASCCLSLFLLPALILPAEAQTGPPAPPEAGRVRLLRDFCAYVRRTPEGHWAEDRLRAYIHASDSAWIEGSARHRLRQGALAALAGELRGLDPARYAAVAWKDFPRPDRLPRMVWEAEPLAGLGGHPLPAGDRAGELAHGRRQLENTLVVFRKDDPEVPLYYILSDGPGGRITSWLLLNQGGLHYFLTL